MIFVQLMFFSVKIYLRIVLYYASFYIVQMQVYPNQFLFLSGMMIISDPSKISKPEHPMYFLLHILSCNRDTPPRLSEVYLSSYTYLTRRDTASLPFSRRKLKS